MIMQRNNASNFSKIYHESILGMISEGVLALTPEGEILYANPAALAITGLSMEELPGIQFEELFSEIDRGRVKKCLKEKQTLCQPMHETGRLSSNQRQISLILWLPEKNGKNGPMVILDDVSDQLQMKERIQRAERMETIATLAGGFAHDLNNILCGLVGYPEMLLMQLPPDDPLTRPIYNIQKAGEKAAAVVQDLLILSRQGVVVSDVVDLNEVIYEYLESPEYEKLRMQHEEVRVQSRLTTDLPGIIGSATHLSYTIKNLISNAAEAMPEGGRIIVSTENRLISEPVGHSAGVKKGRYVILTVSDNGSGLSRHDLERIFEPFYTKKKMGRSGTGLGMAVVWGTVKDHNGYIDVQSEEGKGTDFTLYFPAAVEKPSQNESPREAGTLRGNGEFILIVDDEKEQRQIASEMLSLLGYTVLSVSSGEEAIEYLKVRKADLLVLDMIMEPGMDGLDTYRKILEMHPGQKAIVVSGFSETDRIKELQLLGAGRYVKKPFLLEQIGTAVKRELEKSASFITDKK